ncbi:MAG: GNAT family N-acetyltransferase [Gemmatimonadaceae bacterium]|nr:GNAT family N-acetyltransferase [Gemmatimonadaceae bacterium]
MASAHAPAVQQLAANPAVTATTNLPEPYPADGAASWIASVVPRHAAGLEYAFAIVALTDVATGAQIETAPALFVVGMCGLVMPTPAAAGDDTVPASRTGARAEPESAAEMGYWIGKPFWGCGYATAACRALTTFAFAHTSVTAIDAFPLQENAASRRVLQKLGATLVGVVPNMYPKWPPDRLLAHYRLCRPDWGKSAAATQP